MRPIEAYKKHMASHYLEQKQGLLTMSYHSYSPLFVVVIVVLVTAALSVTIHHKLPSRKGSNAMAQPLTQQATMYPTTVHLLSLASALELDWDATYTSPPMPTLDAILCLSLSFLADRPLLASSGLPYYT